MYDSALGYPGLPPAVVAGGRFNIGGSKHFANPVSSFAGSSPNAEQTVAGGPPDRVGGARTPPQKRNVYWSFVASRESSVLKS